MPMLLPLHSCLCSAVLVAGCMATLANSQALQVATGSTRIGNDHPLEQRYAVRAWAVRNSAATGADS